MENCVNPDRYSPYESYNATTRYDGDLVLLEERVIHPTHHNFGACSYQDDCDCNDYCSSKVYYTIICSMCTGYLPRSNAKRDKRQYDGLKQCRCIAPERWLRTIQNLELDEFEDDFDAIRCCKQPKTSSGYLAHPTFSVDDIDILAFQMQTSMYASGDYRMAASGVPRTSTWLQRCKLLLQIQCTICPK